MISFRCQNCNHKYKVPDKYAGKKAKCKHCDATILIPSQPSIPIELLANHESQIENPSTDFSMSPSSDLQSKEQTTPTDNSIETNDDIPEDYQEIIDEIENLNSPSHGWQKNALILVVTLFIFFKLGLLNAGPSYVIALVVVLLIHEMGHLISMRLFGYHNVRMFFIPFLGAAVSGQSRNVASSKKAIVSLLGPAPGLFLGVISLVAYAKTQINFLLLLGNLFLMLNFFNLLPFFPLDGGRFLAETLFSRNRYIELIFKVLASLALIALGYSMGFWILSIIGLFNLLTIHIPFKVAAVANEIKKTDTSVFSQKISSNTYKSIIDKIKTRIPGKLKAKTIAALTQDVIDRASCRPPKALPALGLVSMYLFFWIAPLLLLATAAMTGMLNSSQIVKYENTAGQTIYSEEISVLGALMRKINLSQDKELYNGIDVVYSLNGSILKEKNWSNGLWHGENKYYNQYGEVIRVAVFDKDEFVSQKKLINRQWQNQTWDDLSEKEKNSIKEHQASSPHGPK